MKTMGAAQIGLVTASIFIIFKMVLFIAGAQFSLPILEKFPILPNLIVVFVGIIAAMLFYARGGSFDIFKAIREGGKVGLTNAVLTAGFVFVYYRWIDSQFLLTRKQNYIAQNEAFIKPEDMPQLIERSEFFNSITVMSTFTLSGMTIFTLLSSLILAVLVRAFLVRS